MFKYQFGMNVIFQIDYKHNEYKFKTVKLITWIN